MKSKGFIVEPSCSRCLMPMDLCLCHEAPDLSSALYLNLITHERERQKTSNTGRLVEASFENAKVQLWARKEQIHWRSDRQQILLFPSEELEAKADSNLFAQQDAPVATHSIDSIEWVLLDATWQQAAKMLRQSTQLQALPRFSVPVAHSSQYHLRRNQRPESLSTVETVIALAQYLSLTDTVKPLQSYFDRFQVHYEAMRSNHSVEGNT